MGLDIAIFHWLYEAVCTFAECLCAQCAYELVQMRGSQLEDWHATASYRNCPTDPTLRKLLIIKIQQIPKKGSKGVIFQTCFATSFEKLGRDERSCFAL